MMLMITAIKNKFIGHLLVLFSSDLHHGERNAAQPFFCSRIFLQSCTTHNPQSTIHNFWKIRKQRTKEAYMTGISSSGIGADARQQSSIRARQLPCSHRHACPKSFVWSAHVEGCPAFVVDVQGELSHILQLLHTQTLSFIVEEVGADHYTCASWQAGSYIYIWSIFDVHERDVSCCI